MIKETKFNIGEKVKLIEFDVDEDEWYISSYTYTILKIIIYEDYIQYTALINNTIKVKDINEKDCFISQAEAQVECDRRNG